MPDIGFGSPVRLGSGQNEGQNLFGFSWSSDSSLLASLAGTATDANSNDPLGWINYAAQTSPGAAPGIAGQPTLTSTPSNQDVLNRCLSGCHGNTACEQNCYDSLPYSGPFGWLGKVVPPGIRDPVKGLGDSVSQAVNQAIIKLAFVLVALVILYVGLRKIANE